MIEGDYSIAPKHSNAYQCSEPRSFVIQYLMLDPKEGLQLPCSCQRGDIIIPYAAVLDLACKHRSLFTVLIRTPSCEISNGKSPFLL